MKIGVFGGSFDPPHFGHYFISKHLIHSRLVDRVILVPTFQHPLKPELEDSYSDRFTMTEMLSNEFNIQTSRDDINLHSKHQGKTFFLMRRLAEINPEHKLHLVIGSDILFEAESWYNFKGIRENWSIIVYGRKGYDSESITVPISFPDLSSTRVREMIKEGKSVSDLVPSNILGYIYKKGLYNEHSI